MLTRFRVRNLAVALGLMGIAAVLVGVYVTSYRHHVQSGERLATIFVASRDIPAGTSGDEASSGKYLSRETVAKHTVVPGAITNTGEISGLIAAGKIYEGQQISVREFQPSVQQGIFAQFSRTQRAMMLPGDANQLLLGQLHAGDRVDVVANIHYKVRTSTASSANDLSRVASRVVLRNLLVLKAPTSSPGGLNGANYAVLLALSDTQAQKLFFAEKNGDWSLVLRPTAKPADSPESVETIESELGDGLGAPQLFQLTAGFGKGSINGQ